MRTEKQKDNQKEQSASSRVSYKRKMKEFKTYVDALNIDEIMDTLTEHNYFYYEIYRSDNSDNLKLSWCWCRINKEKKVEVFNWCYINWVRELLIKLHDHWYLPQYSIWTPLPPLPTEWTTSTTSIK